MRQYRVYYDDGQVLTGDDLPAYGVILILQQRADGRWLITSNAPYYLDDGEEWLPAYENDLVDYLVNKPPGAIKRLLVGRIVSKRNFVQIYDNAKKDRAKMD